LPVLMSSSCIPPVLQKHLNRRRTWAKKLIIDGDELARTRSRRGRQAPQLRLRRRHVQRQLNCAFAVAIVQTIVRLQSSKLAGNVVPGDLECFPTCVSFSSFVYLIPVHPLKAHAGRRATASEACLRPTSMQGLGSRAASLCHEASCPGKT
jgi:hypothetical protein